jgi:protein gp37
MLEPVQLDLRGISWVICGGESGPRARYMPAEWARDVRDQCRAAGVPISKNRCRDAKRSPTT